MNRRLLIVPGAMVASVAVVMLAAGSHQAARVITPAAAPVEERPFWHIDPDGICRGDNGRRCTCAYQINYARRELREHPTTSTIATRSTTTTTADISEAWK